MTIMEELNIWVDARNVAPNEDILIVDAANARSLGFPVLAAICATMELINRGHEMMSKCEVLDVLRDTLSVAVGEARERLRVITGDESLDVPGIPTIPEILAEKRPHRSTEES